jgi:hypothetical protein
MSGQARKIKRGKRKPASITATEAEQTKLQILAETYAYAVMEFNQYEPVKDNAQIAIQTIREHVIMSAFELSILPDNSQTREFASQVAGELGTMLSTLEVCLNQLLPYTHYQDTQEMLDRSTVYDGFNKLLTYARGDMSKADLDQYLEQDRKLKKFKVQLKLSRQYVKGDRIRQAAIKAREYSENEGISKAKAISRVMNEDDTLENHRSAIESAWRRL